MMRKLLMQKIKIHAKTNFCCQIPNYFCKTQLSFCLLGAADVRNRTRWLPAVIWSFAKTLVIFVQQQRSRDRVDKKDPEIF